MTLSKKRIVIGTIVLLAIGIGLGFLVTAFRKTDEPEKENGKYDYLTQEPDEKWSSLIIESVNAANIRTNLKKLTSRPHLAGTPADKRQADELASFWKQNGFKTHITRYNVLLSYPCAHHPNRIELQDVDGNPLYTTQLVEKILSPDQDQSDVVPPFNAYSAPGSPKGDLVYVNFGRIEDFIWLQEETDIDFHDKICIARYGKIFRGDKVKHAERYGCIGMILFSDPQQYANGGNLTHFYPENWWLPPTGVQRGNVRSESSGDPLTPAYPSIDSAYRMNESDANLPNIPVHPIGYGDAYMLLRDMIGEDAPPAWQGGLNFTYKLGPGYTQPEKKVQMFISTSNQNASIYNVFGIIKGSIEQDRYVLLGNHRDAWVFGAVDPSSGTASMMELSRVFGSMVKKGWKPRRTIIFCSWAAEEYSLLGSKEFVEHYRQMLSSRAVAYLNVDSAVKGTDFLRVGALPLLFNVARESAKKVPNPNPYEIKKGRKSVYDTWIHKEPQLDQQGRPTDKPRIYTLGSGSDFDPFIIKTGIPCAHTYYYNDKNVRPFPVYHTVYETFQYMDEHMDPRFAYSKAIAQYWGELAWRLIDAVILPMKPTDYGAALKDYTNNVIDRYGNQMREHGLAEGIDYLINETRRMDMASDQFETRLRHIDRSNPMEVRRYNDQMMQLERTFIDPLGLPGRRYTKHVVFAPSINNRYAGATFPALVDSMFEIHKATGVEENEKWEKVKKQLATVTYFIHAAANNLKDFGAF